MAKKTKQGNPQKRIRAFAQELAPVFESYLRASGTIYINQILRKKDSLPESQRHKASDIDIKFPSDYAKFLQYLLTRETAHAIDQVTALVPKKPKSLSELRLGLDSTKAINDLEDRIVVAWDELSESMWTFINDPFDSSARVAFQQASSALADLSARAISQINTSYNFSPEKKSRLVSKVNSLVDTQSSDLRKAIILQYQTAVDTADSSEALGTELVGALADVVDGPMTLVGPMIVSGQTINDGRDDGAEEIDDEVESFTFANESPVTEICTEMVGITFAKDDPDKDTYQPPLHYNCDSYYVINLKSFKDNPPIDTDDVVLSKQAQKQMNLSESCCGKHDESEHSKFLLGEWRKKIT